jgi:hypothetical protein
VERAQGGELRGGHFGVDLLQNIRVSGDWREAGFGSPGEGRGRNVPDRRFDPVASTCQAFAQARPGVRRKGFTASRLIAASTSAASTASTAASTELQALLCVSVRQVVQEGVSHYQRRRENRTAWNGPCCGALELPRPWQRAIGTDCNNDQCSEQI